MSETEVLAEFVASTSFDDIPTDAAEKAKEAITDYVGVALYGAQHPVGERIGGYVSATAGGDDARMFATGTTSAPAAALANGTFGHAVDYDDTFESIVLHPTSPVFPAALAAGEANGNSSADVLTGYVIGTEVAYRTGHSVYPTHYDNGWHNTGTLGTFGATAAATSTLGLSTNEIRHALGIAGSLSSSLKKNFGTMTKPLHAGHAAEMGVRAAMLADEGFTADTSIFGSDIGYGEIMTTSDGAFQPSVLTEGLGDEWAVFDIGYKPYPSGVITHAAMEALRQLVKEHGLAPENTERVVVALDEAASEMLHHERPATSLEAKFSIEFCLATVLREEDPGITQFTDDYVTADETRELVDLVERDFEENLFGADFANYGAQIEVTQTDGTVLTTEVRQAPGTPSNPLPEDRLYDKFRECTSVVLPESDVEALLETLGAFEEAGQLATFGELIVGSRSG
jgi:2-methylcitrate dehydratase PrpD